MGELTLQWSEQGQIQTQVLRSDTANKSPGRIRVGRDPARCDLVLKERSVSGLHVELLWQAQAQCFYIRNLRSTNPPCIDQVPLTTGDYPLREGSTIQLGRVVLTVLRMGKDPKSVGQNEVGTAGLKCPNPACQRISPYLDAALHCQWCGFSLAGAETIMGAPVAAPHPSYPHR